MFLKYDPDARATEPVPGWRNLRDVLLHRSLARKNKQKNTQLNDIEIMIRIRTGCVGEWRLVPVHHPVRSDWILCGDHPLILERYRED